jgi:motility quorum-sensing regulator / GCU-specific mRNA interferase toxin
MEKRTSHWPLSVVKAMVKEGKVRFTASAMAGADLLGLGRVGIMDAVLALAQRDFYKSMTAHADHTLWQDVYRTATVAGPVYMKIVVVDDVLIVSFKEL